MQRDTRQLFRVGFALFLVGVLAALLTETLFGGIGRLGPHTNPGWVALVFAMGCIPLGLMAVALALAKLAGNRKR